MLTVWASAGRFELSIVSAQVAEERAHLAGQEIGLGEELRALRSLKRNAKSPFIFVSERGAPFTVSGFAKLVERAGIEAKLPFKTHPHMLRHAMVMRLPIVASIPGACRPT